MLFKKISLVIAISLMLFSCATKKKVSNPFNPITLKEKLVKGKTTQKEIIKTFGTPNVITTSSDKCDVWTYGRSATNYSGKSVGAMAIGWFSPVAGIVDVVGKDENISSRSIALTIEFDKKNVLKEYMLTRTQF